MSRKLQTIQALKSKLIKMQKALQNTPVIHNDDNPELPTFKKAQFPTDYNSVPIQRKVPQSTSWKNPTYWGNNPIFGKQNQESGKWRKKQKNRNHTQLSPKLRDLQKLTDNQYYTSQENSVEQNKFVEPTTKYFSSKRYEHSYYGFPQRETPRFEKIKTYDSQQISGILNCRSQKKQGKKIIKKAEKSPKNMLTQNPHSNPYAYFFREKQASLSPKSCHSAKKNRSPAMRQILSPSPEYKALSPKKNYSKTQKKHFSKYFTQTYECKWV